MDSQMAQRLREINNPKRIPLGVIYEDPKHKNILDTPIPPPLTPWDSPLTPNVDYILGEIEDYIAEEVFRLIYSDENPYVCSDAHRGRIAYYDIMREKLKDEVYVYLRDMLKNTNIDRRPVEIPYLQRDIAVQIFKYQPKKYIWHSSLVKILESLKLTFHRWEEIQRLRSDLEVFGSKRGTTVTVPVSDWLKDTWDFVGSLDPNWTSAYTWKISLGVFVTIMVRQIKRAANKTQKIASPRSLSELTWMMKRLSLSS